MVARYLFVIITLFSVAPRASARPATTIELQESQGTGAGPQSTRNSGTQKLIEQGESALRSGNLEAAESAYNEVLSLDSGSGTAYAKLGMISIRRQRWPQAVDLLQKAHQLLPYDPEIKLNLSLAYYRAGLSDSAIPLLESFIRDHEESSQARFLLGLCYFSVGRYPEATSFLKNLWQQKSGDRDYLFVLGFSAKCSGDSNLEGRAQRQFVQTGHSSAEYHVLMGDAFFAKDEYDRAVSEYRQAAQLDPTFPMVHSNLGLAYFRQMDFQNAERELLHAIAIEPSVALSYDRLGVVYFYLNENEQAKKYFQDALTHDPRIASSYFGLSRLYLQEQQFGAAMEAINEAEKIDYENPGFHFLKGQILTRTGNAPEAQSELDIATRLLNANRQRRQIGLGGSFPVPPINTTPP